ncbi:hypothetical protein [Desulfovibrio sp.]|uniref:hypothetical protein n=1 Tax=Desulfovibrio sp. TaxID=885 RepID=UPI0025BEC542|nr:hypothetical protein [Desulfovibrio sp.]
MGNDFGGTIGGLFTLLGSIVALRHQGKLQDGRFAYEQQKAKEEWERQEGRRKEERSFELKRQAYQNYLAVIAQSSRIPIKPMEFKATLALLELSGSAKVSQLASEFALYDAANDTRRNTDSIKSACCGNPV